MAALAACFSPEAPVDAATDGGGGDTTTGPGPSTAAEAGTSDLTSATENPTGVDTDNPDTTDGPTTTDPTVGETESETETTFGGSCSDSSECEAGVCVDMECVPCGDAPDPDAACADADSSLPLCSDDGTTCVACTADSCGGASPLCDPGVGCAACTEHSHCPESACHLGGPEQGSCFDIADVVEVSDTSEFTDAIEAAGSGGQLVLRLSSGTFDYTGFPGFYYQEGVTPQEIALIGDNTIMTGGATTLIFAPPLFYVSDVEFTTGPGRAISSSGDVWLDDTSFDGYGTALLGGNIHMRRSQVLGDPTGTDFGGTIAVDSLTATNCDLGPSGDPMLNVAGALDLRYVTMVGNVVGLDCGSETTGSVRNSILLNSGNSVQGCFGVGFTNNAHDQPGQGLGGTTVENFDPTWFVISDESRFLLSESGQLIFADIADWDDGDPTEDIEGDPRPTKSAGYPGVDEP